MAITAELLVQIPVVPNFIKVGSEYVDVGTLSDETIKKVGQEWTNQLLTKAKKRRKK